MRKTFTVLLAIAMCLGLLCVSAAAATEKDEIVKSETLGVVVVDGDGVYDFGDGSIVRIDPIPGLVDEDIDDIAEDGSSEKKTVEVHVDGDGRYDLGDGVFVVIEPIPEDEMGINPQLYESNSKFPLTSEWTKFCYDEPFLETNVKIYNNSKRNPGNLNASVRYPHGFLEKTVYGIEPGHMATVEGINDEWYYVYLSASVDGDYNVKVTDWP